MDSRGVAKITRPGVDLCPPKFWLSREGEEVANANLHEEDKPRLFNLQALSVPDTVSGRWLENVPRLGNERHPAISYKLCA